MWSEVCRGQKSEQYSERGNQRSKKWEGRQIPRFDRDDGVLGIVPGQAIQIRMTAG